MTSNSQSCISVAQRSDERVPFSDGELIDEPCPDELFLKKLKERRGLLYVQQSPKSNSSLLSSLGSEASRNYPTEAGLKWRHNRDRSGASAVSSLSSISSDGMATYRSSKEIRLSRKFQFTDISELRVSSSDEVESEDVVRVLAALNTVKESPPATSPFPSLWTPERSSMLSKTTRLGKGHHAVLPLLHREETNTEQMQTQQGHKLKPEPQEVPVSSSKTTTFSFNKLLPKFIRRRRFSLPFVPRRHSALEGLSKGPPCDRKQNIAGEGAAGPEDRRPFSRRGTL